MKKAETKNKIIFKNRKEKLGKKKTLVKDFL